MRILYYTWFENSQEDMEETLLLLGYEVVKCSIPFQDYENDEMFRQQLSEVVENYGCDCIFSFNFFPIIAQIAQKFQLKYISWVYDNPHWTLYSPSVKSDYNYIFVFDQAQYFRLQELQLSHMYHFPLAVNTRRLCGLLGTPESGVSSGTESMLEVSFVGSLYENNLYDQIQYLPEYLKGYLEGVMRAQQKIYGYNFVEELLTRDVIEQMNAYISMELPKGYLVRKREQYAAMLNGKITCNERIALLECLSQNSALTLYTASDMTKVPNAKAGGTVNYTQEMPKIFRNSKINLNITLRSIQSGIPLRALDIMGAGGFLLSNYQPELAEQFEDGKELALYGSVEELQDKVTYYLSHDRERQEIAYHGFQKVQKLFSYETQVRKMMEFAQV
ncbi:MAG: glycosyltransferase [Lachnospiraceae bacterium]|jgi:spore maturation protein CgeB|nr:glycosyltransferase [Lachnospiraceae bacterium]